MIQQLVLLIAFLLTYNFSFAQIIVKADSVEFSGYSSLSSDGLTLYAGIASPVEPITGSSNSTVNTCTIATTGAKACNQKSVHSGLVLSVSFQVTEGLTNRYAKLLIENGVSTTTLASELITTAAANSTVITLQAEWDDICSAIGLNSTCSSTAGLFVSRNLKLGVDSDNSGEVETDETKNYTLKVHYIAPTDTVTQSFCSASPGVGNSGMCNVSFIPGDQKAFIDSATYAGADATSGAFEWESIAVFPVLTSPGNEANTLINFTPDLADPIFKNFDNSDGTIPDSAVTGGGIENYQQYCFVYATKNVAQNIYQYVTDAAAQTTACITPSEVVGVLDDKACFISTAAFGSVMAPEVKTFREFRNRFLLNNFLGKKFVQLYYTYSPPLAEIIKQNETLRSFVRTTLYPFLFFAQLTLHFGFLAGTALMLFGVLLLSIAGRYLIHHKKALLVLIFLWSPFIKAEVQSGEKKIVHEGAKEGLVKITKDGTYIYDIVRPLKKESSKVTFGVAYQPEISIDVTLSNNTTNTYVFEDFYTDSQAVIIGYDYENFPWMDKGKLGYQIGASIMTATGNGILVSDGSTSAEQFTFITMPINAGAVYRFEYKDKQKFAPYVAGGGTLLALMEKRDDLPTPKVATGFGFYGAGGMLANISILDPDASFQLESEYGISNLWFALEFRLTEVSGGGFTFSNQYVNAGLSFDF